MSLIKKFILIFIIGLTIPLAFIIYLSYFNSVSIFKNSVFDYLTVNAEQVNIRLNDYFARQKSIYVFGNDEKIINNIIVMSQNPEEKGLLARLISDRLIELKSGSSGIILPDLVGINVVDSQGIVIGSTDDSEIGKDESQSDIFLNSKNLSDETTYVSDVKKMSKFEISSYFLVASSPIFGAENNFLGLIYFYLNASSLENIIKSIPTATLRRVNNYLVNSEGFFIASFPGFLSGDISGKKNETLPVRRCGDKEETKEIYVNYDGVEVIGVSKCLDLNNWVLISEVEYKEILPTFLIFRNQLIFISILVIFLFILPVFMIIKRKANDILEIIAAVSKMMMGRLGERADVRSKDEIGDLASMINQMVKNLQESQDNLIYEKNKAENLLNIEEERHKILIDLNQEVIKILENLDLEKRLIQIVKSAKIIFNVDAASIYLLEGDVFKIKAADGLSDEYVKNQVLQPKKYIIDILSKEHILELDDLEKRAVGDADLIIKENLKSVLVAPFLINSEIYGVICIYSKGKVKKFKNFEKELLKTFSIQMSLGIKNSELFNEVSNEQDRLNTILESMGEGLYVVDNSGRFILFNKKAEEILGWKREEVLNKIHTQFLNIVDANDNSVCDDLKKCSIDLVWKKGEYQMFDDLFFHKKDGLKFPVKITVAPITRHSGVPIMGVVVFLDMTKEKEIEKLRTEFISIASHQLRTPLTAIKWYLELLSMPKSGDLSEKQKHYLQQAYDSSNRMASLVNDLLNVSHIESGEVKSNIVKTDITEIINILIDNYKPMVEEKNIKVDFKAVPEKILMNTDSNIFQQIVQNLFLNAIRYTPEKGRVDIYLEMRSEELFFKITDTGYGILEKEKKRVFSKFFRGENVVKKVTEGTGLGLYIVKSFVDYFCGKIWFESEENKGTTFYFTIPLNSDKIKV